MKKEQTTEEQKLILEKQETEEELYEHFKIIVDKRQEPTRIDKFLFNRLEKVSRNRIQNSIKNGSLLVNGKEVKSSYKVRPTDEITLVLSSPPREQKLLPENIPLDIVYEDDDLAIVNKQAGLVVHPGLGNYTGTLVNGLLYHFASPKSSLPHPDPLQRRGGKNESTSFPPLQKERGLGGEVRPGLVHRIDKNTSGLLVVAKNELAMDFLAKQFFYHTIERTYLALVWGSFNENSGTITGHIGRNPKDRKVMTVFPEGEHGKGAITHYKVVETLGYVTLVECKLETGRTHQIRTHMKYIGHPVFNDAEYGGNKIAKGTIYAKYKQFVENCFQLIPRQALHAKSLGFIHPTTHQQMFFDSPLPPDFAAVLEKWRNYSPKDESALRQI